jgi:hypothetical protein
LQNYSQPYGEAALLQLSEQQYYFVAISLYKQFWSQSRSFLKSFFEMIYNHLYHARMMLRDMPPIPKNTPP